MGPSKAAVAASMSKTTRPVDKDLMQRISSHARLQVENAFKGSPLFSSVEENINTFPKFAPKELVHGKVLGRGQFGTVSEIKRVVLTKNIDDWSTSDEDSSSEEKRDDSVRKYLDLRKSNPAIDSHELQNRQFLADHCLREGGNARYALKVLSSEVTSDPKVFYQAAMDLAHEVYVLSKLEHTNIIKMRGIAMEDMCTTNFFIVMDRLYDTLEKRIVQWKKIDEKTKGMKRKVFDPKGHKKVALLDDRLTVAFDLAAALKYMHSLKIMHRDIKPENIGFDVRGDVKMFDFGLAKELRDSDSLGNGLFHLTGKTGSMRYMAPEIYKEEPYNDRADVYSFSILLWEILFLERPFSGFSLNMFAERVFNEGFRPAVREECSNRIQILLKRCWSQSISERMSSASVTDVLKKELIIVREGDEDALDLAHMQRRSTFVAPRGLKKAVSKLSTRTL